MSGLTQSPSYTPPGANAITRRFADKLKEFPSVRDWNVRGDLTTDDTTNLQRALDGTPDFGLLTVPAGYRMRITSALTLLNRTGLSIGAVYSSGAGSDPGSGCGGFFWDGATGGTMLNVHNVCGSRFENLAFFAHKPGGSTYADTCVDIDQLSGNTVTCTDLLWQRCSFHTDGARTQWVGAYISRTAISNCEVMRFWDCRFIAGNTNDATTYAGKGTCVHVGNSPNSKQHLFHDCSFGSAGYGVYMESGSFTARRCSGYGVRTLYQANTVDPCIIEDNQWEGCGQLFSGGIQSSVTFEGNRFGAIVAGSCAVGFPWIYVTGPGKVFLSGNEWNDSPGQYLCSSDGQADLFATGNRYPKAIKELGMPTFNTYVVLDASGVIVGGGAPYGFGGSLKLATHTGYNKEVFNVPTVQSNLDAHFQPGHRGNLVLGGGGIEVGGCGIPNKPTGIVVGTPNGTYTPTNYSVIALDAAGKRSMISDSAPIDFTPSPLTSSNYIKLDWIAVPNAATYDIVQPNPADSSQFRLVANTAAVTYNIQANPGTSYGSYTLPTYNESATFGAMGAAPVGKQTLPAAATDAATTQALANSLRQALINLGFGA